MLAVSNADTPGNILWENIYVSKLKKMFAVNCSNLITLILLLVTYYGIVYMNEVKTVMAAKYVTVDCTESIFDDITE